MQQYDGSSWKLLTGWALPCVICATKACYMKCRDLGKDGCSSPTMISDRRQKRRSTMLATRRCLSTYTPTLRPAAELRGIPEARGVLAVPRGHDIRRTSCRSRGRETGRPDWDTRRARVRSSAGRCSLGFSAPSSYWRASRSGRCTSGRQIDSGTRAGVSKEMGAPQSASTHPTTVPRRGFLARPGVAGHAMVAVPGTVLVVLVNS